MKKLPTTVIRISLYAVLVAPLLLFGLYAFSHGWFYPQPLPSEWSTAGFERLLSTTRTYQSVITSLAIATIVSLISVIVAIPSWTGFRAAHFQRSAGCLAAALSAHGGAPSGHRYGSKYIIFTDRPGWYNGRCDIGSFGTNTALYNIHAFGGVCALR